MSSADSRGLVDKIFGLCLSILVGSAAIYVAVHLIEAVWTALLVILGVGLSVSTAAVLLRRRRADW